MRLGNQGFVFCDYGDLSAKIINAIKESGQTSLIGPLAGLMAKCWPQEFLRPTLVPIPSSAKNYRKRGYQHISKLTTALEKRIPGASSYSLLRSEGNRVDQVGLTPVNRITNLQGAFSVDLRGFSSGESPIVLVDDVITSGATVQSAKRALEEAGVRVAGFCVFAETKPRTS
ncbi:MAG: hypothetical protein RJA78_670 [Actinomycetota bacterium]|jgi:predicted amidophosphoribosyltransferase